MPRIRVPSCTDSEGPGHHLHLRQPARPPLPDRHPGCSAPQEQSTGLLRGQLCKTIDEIDTTYDTPKEFASVGHPVRTARGHNRDLPRSLKFPASPQQPEPMKVVFTPSFWSTALSAS